MSLFTFTQIDSTQFFINCIIVGVLLSLVIVIMKYAFESILEFFLSFSIFRYGLLACLVFFAFKNVV